MPVIPGGCNVIYLYKAADFCSVSVKLTIPFQRLINDFD